MTTHRAHARRVRATRILATVMAASGNGFGLFTIVFGIVNPEQEPHAFHNVVVASLLIVVSAIPAIAVAREPDRARRPLIVLTVVGVAALVTMALSLTLDPFTLPFVILIGVLWALAPARGESAWHGRPSIPLAALSVAAAAILVPYALEQAELQRTDRTSEHAAFFHWVEMSFYATAIPLLGLLAAVRPVPYRLAGWMAGVALGVMGAAGLLLTGYPSAPPPPVAWAALPIAGLFLLMLEIAVRRGRPGAAAPVAAKVG